MRITNRIMENNSLYNINNNKILQDKLSTQMSTTKKLTRPSDDPVTAIRALRLRTSVSELTQYYEKNAPDADSWLSITEGALSTNAEVLTDLVKKAGKAANKEKSVEALNILLQEMKTLRNEYYSTGNVDFAGRYVFTGYRTNTTLTFTEEDAAKGDSYNMTEPVKLKDFDTISYTNMSKLAGLTKSNYNDAKYDVTEQDVTNSTIHRIRLSYDKLDSTVRIRIGTATVDAGGNEVFKNIQGIDSAAIMTAASAEAGYQQIAAANKAGNVAMAYIPETGELLFSDKAYETLSKAVKDDTEISINYTKSEWEKGDLRPEHYFRSTVTKADGTKTKFNFEADVNDQVIEYDVGYNQTIRVNTMANEAFSHGLDRDIEDLERALSSLQEISATMTDLSRLKKELTEGTADYEKVEKQLDAATKAYNYARENIHTKFENSITSMQGYLDDTNIAVTDNGTRSSRLALISDRLMDQKTTFKTLQSENEDADIAEVTVELTSSKLTYEAALMATGKILQTSLMNYI